MEKIPEGWSEIAALIQEEKNKALDDFQRRGFVPAAAPRRRASLLSLFKPGMGPALAAMAASLLLAAGLVSFWLLRSGWRNVPAAPVLNDILQGSILYRAAGQPEAKSSEAGPPGPSAPYFTAWAAAGLERTAIAAGEPIDPSAPVEHADPGEVRQKIGKVIRENTLERLLARFREIHNKEA